MKIEICEHLKIHDPTPAVKEWCEKNLIIDNPEYFKRERMGKWTGGTDRFIWLYSRAYSDYVLPFGCLRDIWALHPIKDDYEYEIGPIRPVLYESGIKPYAYQENAISAALERKNGILVMPCGAGKTQCGLEIISRIGGRALWLTHTHDLLVQSKSRAQACLMQGGFGTITAGKVDIGESITFATVQTMAKIDLRQYRDAFDVIIVDEAQHCCGTPSRVTMFYKVVSSLRARYKIGLTATPKRADGLQKSMFAILGGKIHEVTKAEVAHTTCPIKVEQTQTGWEPDYDCILMGDGTIDYSKVIDNMIHDEKRTQAVCKRIEQVKKGNPMIVLANRVEFLKIMQDQYDGKSVCLSGLSATKKNKKMREDALRALNDGEIDCIFATYQLAKEGLDVPNLRFVVFATPEKDETTVIQSVGRVGRKAEGKEFGTVIDFVDDFGMYYGWARMRCGYYRKLGAEIL